MPIGTGVSTGVAFAQALQWHAPIVASNPARLAHTVAEELTRFEQALKILKAKNDAVRQKTARRFGDREAAIFDAYHMMLCDEDGLLIPVRQLLEKQGFTAENAVITRFNDLAAQFHAMESDYLRQRAEDIYSLRDQLLREMAGAPDTDATHFDGPTIVVAEALSPVDVANMDLSHLEGIICETGGYSTHTSIIARTLGIPAVMGVAGLRGTIHEGDVIALDGETGEVWINPDRAEIRYLRERSSLMAKTKQVAQLYRGLPTITTDGHRVELGAAASRLEDLNAVLQSDAESIGLYRTEMLHVNRMPLASEEEQFLTFRCILERLPGKPVTIRTFDDGGSMPTLPIKSCGNEANPVMGFRGIRMSLGRPNFFRTQLRAILRASAYGEIKLVLPMVSTAEELDAALEMLENEKLALRQEQVPFDSKLPVGLLVETPSAVFMAQSLIQKVDFFSIGINDLIMLTMGIDRANPHLAHMYHYYHPAVLRSIKQVCEAAHEADKPCYLCGEAPGHDKILPILLGMGLDGFALNANLVLGARRVLNSSSYIDCYRLAQRALSLTSSTQLEQLATEHWQQYALPEADSNLRQMESAPAPGPDSGQKIG